MKNILIIKCGEAPPKIKSQYGDYDEWIIKNSGMPAANFKVVDLPAGEQLRHPGDYAAAIITDSQFHTNQRFTWIQTLKNWLVSARYSNATVLGIGFGLHIIVEAFGGKVAINGNGPFTGVSYITIFPEYQNSPLFNVTGSSFESYLIYNRYVDKLFPGAELMAVDLAGVPMVVRSNKVIGIQFRPEMPDKAFKSYMKLSKLPSRAFLGGRLSSEHKNYSFLSNFLGVSSLL